MHKIYLTPFFDQNKSTDKDILFTPFSGIELKRKNKYDILDLRFPKIFESNIEKDKYFNIVDMISDQYILSYKKKYEDIFPEEYSLRFYQIITKSFFFPIIANVVYYYIYCKKKLEEINYNECYVIETVKRQLPRNFINKDDFLNNLYASSDLYEWFFSVIIENINPPNIKIIRKKNINLLKPYISSKNNSFYDFFNSFKNLENLLKPHRYIFYFLKCVSGIFPDRIKTFNNVYGVGPFQSLLFSLIINFRSVYSKNKPIAKNEHISEEDLSQNPVSIELPDDLMSLIDKVILELLPEEYGIKKFNEKIHKTSSNKFKKNRLRIDFTSMGDSDKSFFQAMAQEKGERLYYCQHGSDYMTQKKLWGFNAVETRGEGFIKWGEEDLPGCHGLKFVTASSPFFSRIANKHKCSRDEIIFVGTIYYVLFNGICSKEPSYFFDYINAKHRFLSILSSDVMEKMWYRPWVHKGYWNNFDDFEFVNHYFPSIRELSGNLKKRMLACKILVLDHYGTCFYEAMVSNTPVMMYYAHPQATKHPQADLMFSKLKSIGIIHDTPDSAAKMINEIWPDVKTWWQSKDVQNLRNEFCTKYALTNKFWRLEWAKMVWNQ